MRSFILAAAALSIAALSVAGLSACPDPFTPIGAESEGEDEGETSGEGEGEGAGEGEGEGESPRCAPGVAVGDDVVGTTEGPVRGEKAGDTWRFRGVRFAAPPVGELRFRGPAKPACHSEVVDALDYGNACPQLGFALDAVVGDEDCLFLNVWTPHLSTSAAPAPVLFFIHGGANIIGEASQPLLFNESLYDGQALSEATGAVVVTANYRLGALGFLAHPALTATDGTSGNAGIKDAIKATLDQLHTTHRDRMRSLLALNFQVLEPAALRDSLEEDLSFL